MKYLLSLVALACVANAVAVPLDGEQAPFGVDYKHPGFDWDLSAQRLVQIEGQAPVWMTELEKVAHALVFSVNRLPNSPDSRETTRHQVL
jgi:leucyl aminopeptidase